MTTLIAVGVIAVPFSLTLMWALAVMDLSAREALHAGRTGRPPVEHVEAVTVAEVAAMTPAQRAAIRDIAWTTDLAAVTDDEWRRIVDRVLEAS